MAYIESRSGQSWLLPPSLEDLIPEDHICYLIESLVDSLDYSVFDIRYSGAGHPAYHPRILVKLLIMGVLDRVRSSRGLARNARENGVYMYLLEKLTPDFRTIRDFRKDNPLLVKEVFRHTVGFAKQGGMLDLSHLATGGSKIKANASNRKVLTKEELEVLLRFVDGELEEWSKRNEIEDQGFGELRGMSLRKGQVNVFIRSYQAIGADGLKKVSITDPVSRFMKNKKGRIELSYNPQVTVDKEGFVLANDVCRSATDTEQLQPQVIQTGENLGGLPEHVVWNFDAGYFESEHIKFLMDKGINGYLQDNTGEKGVNPYDKKNFTYDRRKDEYRCPKGQKITFMAERYDRQKGKTVRIYKGQSCAECKEQRTCTDHKDGIRYLKMFPHEGERNAMMAKMKTPQAKETYKLRQQTVEPVIGDIKENKGSNRFLQEAL